MKKLKREREKKIVLVRNTKRYATHSHICCSDCISRCLTWAFRLISAMQTCTEPPSACAKRQSEHVHNLNVKNFVEKVKHDTKKRKNERQREKKNVRFPVQFNVRTISYASISDFRCDSPDMWNSSANSNKWNAYIEIAFLFILQNDDTPFTPADIIHFGIWHSPQELIAIRSIDTINCHYAQSTRTHNWIFSRLSRSKMTTLRLLTTNYACESENK